jgi:hypothetical protein
MGAFLVGLDQAREASKLVRDAVTTGSNLGSHALEVNLVVAESAVDRVVEVADAVAPEMVVRAVEVKLPRDAREVPASITSIATAGFTVYVELSTQQVAAGNIDELAERGLKLKYRTGGLASADFPTARQLAAVLAAAARRHLALKLTAGLHGAVRHRDPLDGFLHHGFLNVAVGSAYALAGASVADIEANLAIRDESRLVSIFHRQTPAWRTLFESFGTCNTTEPVETLIGLGLLPRGLLEAEGK